MMHAQLIQTYLAFSIYRTDTGYFAMCPDGHSGITLKGDSLCQVRENVDDFLGGLLEDDIKKSMA